MLDACGLARGIVTVGVLSCGGAAGVSVPQLLAAEARRTRASRLRSSSRRGARRRGSASARSRWTRRATRWQIQLASAIRERVGGLGCVASRRADSGFSLTAHRSAPMQIGQGRRFKHDRETASGQAAESTPSPTQFEPALRHKKMIREATGLSHHHHRRARHRAGLFRFQPPQPNDRREPTT